MSNFILNLAKRGAGLAPLMALPPSSPPIFLPAAEAPLEMTMPHTAESPEALGTWREERVLSQPKLATLPLAPRVAQPVVLPPDALTGGTPAADLASGLGTEKSEPDLVSTSRAHRLALAETEVVLPTPGSAFASAETPSVATPATSSPTLRPPIPDLPEPALARIEPAVHPMTRQDLPVVRPAPLASPTLREVEKAGAPTAEPRPIQVRIGAIEVRATTPPAPAPPSAPVSQGFDDYVLVRTYARREEI